MFVLLGVSCAHYSRLTASCLEAALNRQPQVFEAKQLPSARRCRGASLSSAFSRIFFFFFFGFVSIFFPFLSPHLRECESPPTRFAKKKKQTLNILQRSLDQSERPDLNYEIFCVCVETKKKHTHTKWRRARKTPLQWETHCEPAK